MRLACACALGGATAGRRGTGRRCAATARGAAGTGLAGTATGRRAAWTSPSRPCTRTRTGRGRLRRPDHGSTGTRTHRLRPADRRLRRPDHGPAGTCTHRFHPTRACPLRLRPGDGRTRTPGRGPTRTRARRSRTTGTTGTTDPRPTHPVPLGPRPMQPRPRRGPVRGRRRCGGAGGRGGGAGPARRSEGGRFAGLLVLRPVDPGHHQGEGEDGRPREAVGARPVPGPAGASTRRHAYGDGAGARPSHRWRPGPPRRHPRPG